MAKTDVSLGTDQLLEQMFLKRAERLPLEHKAKLLEEQEKTIAAELIKRNIGSGIHGPYGVTMTKTEEPFGADWVAIVKYIQDTGEVDLLEKRLLKSGVKRRWEDGIAIPGVDKVEKTSIKVEKL